MKVTHIQTEKREEGGKFLHGITTVDEVEGKIGGGWFVFVTRLQFIY
jgi:hypothetical protein